MTVGKLSVRMHVLFARRSKVEESFISVMKVKTHLLEARLIQLQKSHCGEITPGCNECGKKLLAGVYPFFFLHIREFVVVRKYICVTYVKKCQVEFCS